MELSINDIYKMLLPLSPNNKLWLAEKLIENTLSLVIGTLPKDFDIQKATDE